MYGRDIDTDAPAPNATAQNPNDTTSTRWQCTYFGFIFVQLEGVEMRLQSLYTVKDTHTVERSYLTLHSPFTHTSRESSRQGVPSTTAGARSV